MTFHVDLQVHKDASLDGLSSLAEQAAAARAAGLSAMAVTDHNLCTPLPPVLDGVLMIPGCEVSTTQGHILGLFLEVPLDLEALRQNGLPTGAAAVAEIHRCGGVAVLAHPYEKPGADPTGFDFRPDAVEAVNARATLKVKEANGRAAALAKVWALPNLGGSDAHARQEVGNAHTKIEAEELTLEALKAAILAGACVPVLRRETPHLRKGLSQLAQRKRKGGAINLAVGAAYVVYCAGLDLFRS